MAEIKSWKDVEAISSVPLLERRLPGSTFEMLEQGAEKNPDAPALHFFLQAKGTAYRNAETYRFRDLLGEIRQTANLFHSLGLGKEEVVSYLLPNLPETHWTLWGGEAAGIVNPINPLLEPSVVADILNAAGTKILVTLAPFPKVDLWEKVDAIREKVPSLEIILRVDLSDHVPGLGKWIMKAGLLHKRFPRKVKGQKVLDFNQVRSSFPKDHFSFQRTIQPGDIASLFHTGGTTGTPKLAMHTHWNEVVDTWSAMQFLGREQGEGLNFFCGLPLFHVNGAFITGLGPWAMGAAVTLGTPQGYRAPGLVANFWKIVEHYKLTFFSGVPAVYSNLLNVPVGDHDISSLEFAICGAAPMPVEVFKDFEKKTGVRILEGYGCTEGTCASSVNPPYGERRVGSIGFSLPYQEMKIAILDEKGAYQREAKTDEIGSVLIRGENVFHGYKEAVHNQDIWVDSGDGGKPWYNTGDLGRRDPDGYFWLTGRKKELIIRGGHNIDPKLIEEPLYLHPAVEMVAAVGSPDARVGEVPAVFIQLKPGAQVTPQEIYAFAQEHIGEKAALPKAIHLVDQMPLTAVGKIHKLPLRLAEIERVLTYELQQLPTVENVQVKAEPDKRYGEIARVSINPKKDAPRHGIEQEAQALLGKYALHVEITLGA